MTVVATIYCGRCNAERHPEPVKLGEVVALPGRLLWHGFDSASAQKLSNYNREKARRGVDPPQARHSWTVLDQDAPDRLAVWCRRRRGGHGPGSVSTADVIAARGSMSVEFVVTR